MQAHTTHAASAATGRSPCAAALCATAAATSRIVERGGDRMLKTPLKPLELLPPPPKQPASTCTLITPCCAARCCTHQKQGKAQAAAAVAAAWMRWPGGRPQG